MALSVERTLLKARRLAKKGSFDGAAREYERILEKFPKNKRARDELRALRQTKAENGAAGAGPLENQVNRLIELYNRAHFEELLARGERLADVHPDEPALPNLLGAANSALGRLERAATCYTEALRLKPDYAEAHNNLGVVLYQMGRLEEAMTSCQKALGLNHQYAEAYNNLGNILNELDRYQDAVDNYNRALAIKPDYADAHANLGNALSNLGDPDAAVDSFNKALEINPNFAEAYNNLGNALLDLGRPQEAVASFEEALRIKPGYAAAHNSLGAALKALGRFEEATERYEQALRLKRDFSEAHLNLSMAKRFRDGDARIQDMQALIEIADLSIRDRMRLNFALGKAYDDLGDYDRAFAYLEAGNRLRKKDLGYDISASETTFSHIKSIFSHDVPALSINRTAGERADPLPIFVLGMPRSGTTLVEQILAAHSLVHGAGELELLNHSISTIIHSAACPTIDQMRAIRQSYLSGLGSIGAPERYVTDKLPLNFLWIGFIVTALPEARIVHVKRDARATCWSNFKHYFSRRGTGFSNDLCDIARFYTLYAELMAFWHEMYPGRIYDLHYESLTENQKLETERLLQYIGLNPEAQCMEFYKVDRSVRTASAAQVRQKMYQGSSEKWRKYEKHLGPMLQSLGMA